MAVDMFYIVPDFPASTRFRNMPTHRTMFERAMAALPDGVLLIDAARRVLYSNPAFIRHWGIPPDILETGDDTLLVEFVTSQLVDPDEFHREVERLHPTSESSEHEIHFKDGRIFSRRSVPFEEDGAFQARIWIFTDITESRNATLDALTGLPNRRAYSRDFPGYVTAIDDGYMRSVALMDVDNFKSYNDLYGHAAGDLVLRSLGEILRSHLDNADDLIFRVGGEEFLMALRRRQASDALQFFEALRKSVAAMGITHRGNPPHGVVSTSIGLGTFRGPKDPVDIFRCVDVALYEAKAKGRNLVSVVEIEPA